MFCRVCLVMIMICVALPGVALDELAPIKIYLDTPEDLPKVKSVQAVTTGPKHHFFGYYGMKPWDPTGKQVVCMETEFGDRAVEAGEKANICLVDLDTGRIETLTETGAWNFQQGSLLHWLGDTRRIIFNDRVDGEPMAVVMDVDTKERRVLPMPLAAVSLDGKYAASINYGRLFDTRPGYGYPGAEDPNEDHMHPPNLMMGFG